MKITIETIPQSEQRYDTLGDWFYNPIFGEMVIRVSDLGNWRYEALIGVHELIEAILCRDRSITTKEVDAFDKAFKKEGEPGDDPEAPYYHEHQFASAVERLLCGELTVNWHQYDEATKSV